ncbi:MAG: hypothetical protein H8E12_11850 [Rhodobacteraceae bacterium]|nr:hypothetical protein [Paracoccaceae bacterium]
MTTYVFDIDGTICTKVDGGDYSKAVPMPERIAIINKLYDEGNTIVFQTARGMGRSGNSQAFAWEFFEKDTKTQLVNWGVKFHSLYMGKPSADIYVDDKAIDDNKFFDIHKRIKQIGE